MTNINKTKIAVPILAALAMSVKAKSISMPAPSASAYADAESSLTVPFTGWRADTREFRLTIAAPTNSTSAVTVAIGRDADEDGELSPAEADILLGVDCGEIFFTDERIETTSSSLSPLPSSPFSVSLDFDLSGVFDREWNLARLTTHNLGDASASFVAFFKNHPFVIRIR